LNSKIEVIVKLQKLLVLMWFLVRPITVWRLCGEAMTLPKLGS